MSRKDVTLRGSMLDIYQCVGCFGTIMKQLNFKIDLDIDL